MTRYLVSFGDGAMDIPPEDLTEVDAAARDVMGDAQSAGVWVTGGGIAVHEASVVGVDGSVRTELRPAGVGAHLGGFCVIEVSSHDEALRWAARFAAACRCSQEVWPLMDDPDA